MINKKDQKIFNVIDRYRFVIALIVIACLTTIYLLLDNTKIDELFINLYPEIAGVIIVFIIFVLERKFIFKGLGVEKNKRKKNIIVVKS